MRRILAACGCAFVLLQMSCLPFASGSRIDLGGDWEFRRLGEGRWRPARVPGCALTDLVANRLAPDPFFGAGEAAVQALDSASWEYRKAFRVGVGMFARDHIDLVCEGLDTFAEVYVNDSLVLEADNMFRSWVVPCKEALREGPNEIRVVFRSPVRAVEGAWASLPAELPGGPQVLARKAAYQYGWDWAPRLVTCGIWRPIRFAAWDDARIADFSVSQEALDGDLASLRARFEIESVDSIRARLLVRVDGREAASLEVDIEPGRATYGVPFTIERPELWWTNGLGEARLYDVQGEIRGGAYVSGERTGSRMGLYAIDRASRRIGLRTLELVAEPDGVGESFRFELNGVPLYAKGANVVPQDAFPARVTRSDVEYLVGMAAAASMNMLRVWGGGIYQSDDFYDLCDEYGILVWQDFMFACAMYPGDPRFLRGVAAEADGVVKRLRSHPCLALWCGNNEIDEAWHNWGWQRQYGYSPLDSARIWRDYEKLFHELLPSIVEDLDPGRPYVSSSPRFGRGDRRCLAEGDCHYWGVWHDGEPFAVFESRVPRFMSEFGFQSFPSFGSIERFTNGDDRAIDSKAMLAHQKHPRGNELVRSYMARDYRVPEDFSDFTYVSQLLQAEGVRRGIEAQRRARPFCMGSLFWQLNDCWPAVSWSAIDWYGEPKALWYAARESYGSVLVSPAIEDGAVRVWIVSDEPEATPCTLDLEMVDFAGDLLWSRSIDVELPPSSSERYFEMPLERALRGRDPSSVVLKAEVLGYGSVLARKHLYFVPPKDLDLPAASIVVEPLDENGNPIPPIEPAPSTGPGGPNVRPGQDSAQTGMPRPEKDRERERPPRIRPLPRHDDAGLHPRSFRPPRAVATRFFRLHAETFAKNVYLSAIGANGYFSRNYFDMLPGDTIDVEFVSSEGGIAFPASLRIVTLSDVYEREESPDE